MTERRYTPMAFSTPATVKHDLEIQCYPPYRFASGRCDHVQKRWQDIYHKQCLPGHLPRVVTYGKNYRAVRTLTISAEGTEGYATVQLPNNADRDDFVVHPILMDAMLHVAGFIANIKVGCVEVIPRLIDDNAPYGVYVNCAWLPGATCSRNRIHFRKVPLTTLEHGLTLAAGPEASSSGLSFTPPAEVKPGVVLSKSRSRSGSVLSKSRSRSGSVLSPGVAVNGPQIVSRGADSSALSSQFSHDIKAETVGNTLEMPRINPDHSSGGVSDDGDDSCQSDVKALLAAVLGLEVEELCEDTDLELLGLDSLASIEAHHALQSHFSMLLPSDLFTTHTNANASTASCKLQIPPDSADTARPTAVRSDCVADCLETLPVSVQRTKLPGRVPLLLIHDGSGLVSYIRWSFGGIVAFEVARHLLKADVAVKGVVLIDSPSPLDHVPLSDALIESAVKLDNNRGSGSVPSGIGLLVKEQFRMNSRMLRVTIRLLGWAVSAAGVVVLLRELRSRWWAGGSWLALG
ncbi:hypothetical protein BJV77DRAFT_962951 [Russula vinacea]|nr:hypothetical protein BJV77DRAFT_962951 [Russula vinacea]